MWWQYLIMAIISISAALIAVYVAHRLSRKHEYRKGKVSVKSEIADNIQICYFICGQIDIDLNASEEDKWTGPPYHPVHELAWSTYKGVILLRNSELAAKIEVAYFHIPIANNFLHRTEVFKWGPAATLSTLVLLDNLEEAKRYISEIVLPQLKEAKELLEKGS